MSMVICILLLGQLSTISIHLYAADPSLLELDLPKEHLIDGPPLTLERLCLQSLKKLPPKHFKLWKDMALELKQKFIIEHGLTYKPTLFVLEEAIQRKDCPKTDGIIQKDQLRLCNRFAQVIIGKQKPDEYSGAKHNEEQLPTYELFGPDFTCACLQGKHIYVGSESGKIHHYSVERCTPALTHIQEAFLHPITYIITHPSLEHIIACRDMENNIGIYHKNKEGAWGRQRTINHNWFCRNKAIKKMTFSPSGKLLACADDSLVFIYDLMPTYNSSQFTQHGLDTLDALLFKDDQTSVMNGKSGQLNSQKLIVWKFRTDTDASSYTVLLNTSKIILNRQGCYGFDGDFEDEKWLTNISSSILFQLVLDHIQSQQELKRFKEHKDKLHCGEEPLFKLNAIMKKTHELQKAEEKRELSVDMRK